MIVGPIVFCVVVHGIAGAGDLKKVGRLGLMALVYFEVMTTVALIVGVVLAYLLRPARPRSSTRRRSTPRRSPAYAENAHKLQGGGFGEFILNIIPSTAFDALARNDVLQVLFFAIAVRRFARAGRRARRLGRRHDRRRARASCSR